MPRITGLATVMIRGRRYDGVSFDMRASDQAIWNGRLTASWQPDVQPGGGGALWLPDGELIGFKVLSVSLDRHQITARFSPPIGYAS